jgi:hypothetical protein
MLHVLVFLDRHLMKKMNRWFSYLSGALDEKTMQRAREFCKVKHGGDLAIIRNSLEASKVNSACFTLQNSRARCIVFSSSAPDK